ncbi:MAG: hypothetical protein GYA55_03185 [SAR324 cluster bacterium]|uniref:Uncharacterized protein n=1 Tax=SAR324 cluster bacterium TaxID=2024889 RepID=A0A7X9FPY2_9DELT|nr:hypothetical protein [SAR324 cluster bacterium]
MIEGKIKSEALTGQGYLEMLSTFPNGQTYFSRTLSKKGPQAALSGSFDWRPFSLPFIRSKNSPAPNLLSFNIKAPKGAVLYLSEIKLLQGATLDEGWLSREELGLIGGVLGGVLGCLGGLIGLLSAKGKAQNLVKLIIALCIILALGLLVTGLLAALYSQPEYMYTSLLISGAFLILLFVFVQRSVSKCYQEIELRRIKAQDTL